MSYRIYDPNIVASRIKQLRKEKGITQSELAEGSGLGLSTIKQYESKTRVPDKHNLSLLANYFFVDEDWQALVDGNVSDTQIFHHTGNSIVVDVVECILCQIFDTNDEIWL